MPKIRFKKLTKPDLYRGNKPLVAILYSPGYGAGWSTWEHDEIREALIFDRAIVQAVLDDDREKAARIASEKYGAFTNGAATLQVMWLPQGTPFEIRQYDGAESVHTNTTMPHTA